MFRHTINYAFLHYDWRKINVDVRGDALEEEINLRNNFCEILESFESDWLETEVCKTDAQI